MRNEEWEQFQRILLQIVQLNVNVADYANEINRKLDKIIENQEEGKAK